MVFYGSKTKQKSEGANTISLLDESGEPQAGTIYETEDLAAMKPKENQSPSNNAPEQETSKNDATKKAKKSYAAWAAGAIYSAPVSLYSGTIGRLYKKKSQTSKDVGEFY